MGEAGEGLGRLFRVAVIPGFGDAGWGAVGFRGNESVFGGGEGCGRVAAVMIGRRPRRLRRFFGWGVWSLVLGGGLESPIRPRNESWCERQGFNPLPLADFVQLAMNGPHCADPICVGALQFQLHIKEPQNAIVVLGDRRCY